MRVISGRAKGRRLQSVPGESTRAITDRVKSALFSILLPRLPGTRMLDLFGGTGAVGIEALSRGASFVVFCERDRLALRTLGENLRLTGLAERAHVVRGDAFQFLQHGAVGNDGRRTTNDGRAGAQRREENEEQSAIGNRQLGGGEARIYAPFDFIYIAPPQYQGLWLKALTLVDQMPQWLTEDGMAIVQIHPKERHLLALANLELVDERKYGSTVLLFYARKIVP